MNIDSHSNLLKSSDGDKTVSVKVQGLWDAPKAGGEESQSCTLIIVEGLSAKNFVMSGMIALDSERFGIYPICGKFLNVRTASHKKLESNKQIKDIKKILGLKQDIIYSDTNSLRYGQVLLMTDQDVDGSHIKGLLINFFHRYWPSLLLIPKFISEFVTPIVKATRKEDKATVTFYSMYDYQRWKNMLEMKEYYEVWSFTYYKGLANFSNTEAVQLFTDISNQRKSFVWEDDKDGGAIKLVFSNTKESIQARKKLLLLPLAPTEMLRNWEENEITYKDFIHKDLIFYYKANLQRSIPMMADGC